MNTEQEHTADDLQHEAEHTRPRKRGSVMVYLAILFAAAFLLLLMSYFMQQRINRETLDDLQKTSTSAVQSLDNLIAERDRLVQERQTLEEQLEELERQSETLQTQLDAAAGDVARAEQAAQTVQAQAQALQILNEIRALYNQHRNREARELLAEHPDLETQLENFVQGMSQEERKIYDPLESYRSLAGWLNP